MKFARNNIKSAPHICGVQITFLTSKKVRNMKETMTDFTANTFNRNDMVKHEILLKLCEPLSVENVVRNETFKQMFVWCRRQDGSILSLPLHYFKIKEAKDLEKPMMVTKIIKTDSFEADAKGRKYPHISVRYEVSPVE
jgi:hypothetical protein